MFYFLIDYQIVHYHAYRAFVTHAGCMLNVQFVKTN